MARQDLAWTLLIDPYVLCRRSCRSRLSGSVRPSEISAGIVDEPGFEKAPIWQALPSAGPGAPARRAQMVRSGHAAREPPPGTRQRRRAPRSMGAIDVASAAITDDS